MGRSKCQKPKNRKMPSLFLKLESGMLLYIGPLWHSLTFRLVAFAGDHLPGPTVKGRPQRAGPPAPDAPANVPGGSLRRVGH